MKRICLCTLSSLIVFSALAQDSTTVNSGKMMLVTPMAVKTRFGIAAGINEAKVQTENAPGFSTTMRTSFHVGAFINIPLGTTFRFQPGLMFSGQGSKVAQSIGTSTTNYDLSLHYINIPMMLQWQTKSGFFLELGPQPGVLISAKNKPSAGGANTDVIDNYDKFDIAGAGGIGFLSRIGIGFNARYITSFKNANKETSSTDKSQWRNQVIQLGLVYHFGAFK